MRNKTLDISEHILEHDVDIMAITETWLRQSDNVKIQETIPHGYKFLHQPRGGKTFGGGLALFYKDNLHVELQTKNLNFKTFEFMELLVTVQSKLFRLVIIYRPPPSKKNQLKTSMFFDEFNNLLEHHTLTTGTLLMIGDFNLHVDVPSNYDAKRFLTLLQSTNYSQWVDGPTHRNGHTLDLIITRNNDSPIRNITMYDDIESDHFSVVCGLNAYKPQRKKIDISYRKIHAMDREAFKKDVKEALSLSEDKDLDLLFNHYNTTLMKILDKHAPVRKMKIHAREKTPWMTEEIKEARRIRRQAERRWRKTKLTVHRQIYKQKRQIVTELIAQAKKQYYSDRINEKEGDQKALFKVIDELMQRKQASPLPPHDDPKLLATQFGEFFIKKIKTIQDGLKLINISNGTEKAPETPKFVNKMTCFEPVTIEETRKLVMKSPTKSCELDPIPTWLLKETLDEIVPIITKLINISISTGTVSSAMKEAQVTPLLKKANLELIFKNFRPVSNLTFISKTIERVVARQLLKHMEQNGSIETFQSAYREYHSTETALLRVQNDILQAMDGQKVTILVLLDLSAAFDTVEHSILLDRIKSRFGIEGTPLPWNGLSHI